MGLSLPSIREDNRRWWTLGAMCFALFMIMLDNTVVNVALPSIQRDLDVSVSSLEWTVNAYTLTFAVLLVTGGRLGDIFGRRRGFITGVVIFGLSSLFIAFSQSGEWLIVGRAVQGVGAAFMMPATLSIISNAFPRARARPRDRHVGRDLGAGARDRPRRRRLPRRERLVAVDLPDQRPGRRGAPSSSRCGRRTSRATRPRRASSTSPASRTLSARPDRADPGARRGQLVGLGLARDHRPARLLGDRADRVRPDRAAQQVPDGRLLDLPLALVPGHEHRRLHRQLLDARDVLLHRAVHAEHQAATRRFRPACASCPRRS